jgi:hypothetical protein
MVNCKICNSKSELFLNSYIFDTSFLIDYFKCSHCGFLQTQEPTWLDKSYSEAITSLDIGLLNRNINFSNLTEQLLLTFFIESKSYLDFGAGYGVFVRMMRDKGFDFKWYDTHCDNLFAKHFEEFDLLKKFDIITAFEVFEHLPHPLEQLTPLLQNSDTLIFSTFTNYQSQKDFDNWWYRAPLSGQHVSFYTSKSLQILAEKFNKYFYTNNLDFHFISSKKINTEQVYRFFFPTRMTLQRRVINKLLGIKERPLIHKQSLLQQDFDKLTNLFSKRNN